MIRKIINKLDDYHCAKKKNYFFFFFLLYVKKKSFWLELFLINKKVDLNLEFMFDD